MRAFSGVASITIHVGLGAAVLLGPAKTGRSNPKSPDPVSIVFPQPAARTTTSETRFVSFRRLIPSLLAARQALLATLFRPAFVSGRAVRVRVRIPYDFTIRNGTGRAR